MDSEPPTKTANSSKRKRVKNSVVMGQGDDTLSGTSKMMTDVAMVPTILMAGIRSFSYRTKRSDRNQTRATPEMEKISQCGESPLLDFKQSCKKNGNGGVIGHLTPVEFNRLTVSETCSIDKPACGYMVMTEYSNSARGHLIAPEKNAMKRFLEEMNKDTTMKQRAYETLTSFDMHTTFIKN